MPAAGTFVLDGQRALVLGGTRGIGFACARSFADAGTDRVMLVDRNAERERARPRGCREV